MFESKLFEKLNFYLTKMVDKKNDNKLGAFLKVAQPENVTVKNVKVAIFKEFSNFLNYCVQTILLCLYQFRSNDLLYFTLSGDYIII